MNRMKFGDMILNIDTSLETAGISLASEGVVIASAGNNDQKDHASWIHEAIRTLLEDNDIKVSSLKAIAVTSGPGSYTGIRVGMASAKGLAYALGIPLITLNTLKVMAWSQQNLDANQEPAETAAVLYCPMIDARRDEVFTAVYDKDLNEVVPPCALRLTETSFAELLVSTKVVFFGNGSDKWQHINKYNNAMFQKWDYAYFNLAYLGWQACLAGAFADLAYVQPEYLKEVYTYQKK